MTGPTALGDGALDQRKAAVLNAIVADFIAAGEPVGSKRLVSDHGLGVSSATVRSDMVALEEAGYITHPHRSAGRIPTDKGYRFFVDSLADQRGRLLPEQQALLDEVLLGAGDLEDLLRKATQVLSRLTRFAALVAAPRLDRSRLKHVELLPLSPTTVMAVVIADTGRVDKRVLDLDVAISVDDVQRARHAVNNAAAGLRGSQAPDVISGIAAGAPQELRGLLEQLAESLRIGTTDDTDDPVFVGGTANIAAGHFERLEQVKQVYEALEEQGALVRMLRDTLAESDPAVRIGEELLLAELAACAVVASSYEAGDAAGSVGVLGPSRMDYRRTLVVVQAVASTLERALAELVGDAPPPSDQS